MGGPKRTSPDTGPSIAIGGRPKGFHVGDAAQKIGGLGQAILLSGRLMMMAQQMDFAEEIYDALCNTAWAHRSGTQSWACTWRCAGDIAAALRGHPNESYMTFYCSGGEGRITERVRTEFRRLGWSEARE
jgi:hypothetical protein